MAMKLVSFAALSAFAIPVLAAQNVVKVNDLHPGIVINKDHMLAADLAIWNPPTRYFDMAPALVDGGYTVRAATTARASGLRAKRNGLPGSWARRFTAGRPRTTGDLSVAATWPTAT